MDDALHSFRCLHLVTKGNEFIDVLREYSLEIAKNSVIYGNGAADATPVVDGFSAHFACVYCFLRDRGRIGRRRVVFLDEHSFFLKLLQLL